LKKIENEKKATNDWFYDESELIVHKTPTKKCEAKKQKKKG
jgi:hypothetical protein